MMASLADLPVQTVHNLFCSDSGYQTPKLDTRAANFREDQILLVQEQDGKWSLPGGWVDVNLSIKENTIKETKEEAGLDVICERIIAVQDREKHNQPKYPYGVCKIFVLCSVTGGSFRKNSETLQSAYFSVNELPCLSENKNTAEQIEMCWRAYRNPDWQVQFD